MGPDFRHITSRTRAEDLCRKGRLERLFLLPPELGGQDVPENVVYVPPGIVAAKQHVDDHVIRPLVAAGKITSYRATPEYEGQSFVPIAIQIVASDPGSFTTTIAIWGTALGSRPTSG